MPKKFLLRAVAIVALFALLITLALPTRTAALQQDDPVMVAIIITARTFHPSQAKLHLDRDVLIVFHNQDAELHAFVPKKFLEHVPLHVTGNGAPQFGEQGLIRVLIPSGGLAKLRFRPQRAGRYEYRCDLPGHQMVAYFLVEENVNAQIPP
jgi:uncharacterized cupredoxin-like copper-binding protein